MGVGGWNFCEGQFTHGVSIVVAPSGRPPPLWIVVRPCILTILWGSLNPTIQIASNNYFIFGLCSLHHISAMKSQCCLAPQPISLEFEDLICELLQTPFEALKAWSFLIYNTSGGALRAISCNLRDICSVYKDLIFEPLLWPFEALNAWSYLIYNARDGALRAISCNLRDIFSVFKGLILELLLKPSEAFKIWSFLIYNGRDETLRAISCKLRGVSLVFEDFIFEFLLKPFWSVQGLIFSYI